MAVLVQAIIITALIGQLVEAQTGNLKNTNLNYSALLSFYHKSAVTEKSDWTQKEAISL